MVGRGIRGCMIPANDPIVAQLRRALAGRYELHGLLGRGGMGVVYRAHDLRLERSVALKVPPPDRAADPAFRARFLREARTAAALAHPNIVPIFAVHEVGPFIFYAMAYVDGDTLARRIAAHGPLPAADTARLLGELADALAYAHARGIVHRDVKPDNILLDSASGRALLSDFGIAHVTRDGRAMPATYSGSVFGTVQFMSPEQARGEPVDGRSDLYSLGVVGYYVLTGRLPFSADSDAAVVALHCTTPPPPLVSPGVPRRLGQAVERCLAKLPADRFQDGAALGRALAAALPGGAPPPIAVRAFLTRSSHLAGPALLYEAFVGLLVAPAALWCWLYGGSRLLDLAAVSGAVAALLLPLGVAWARARRLLTDGHGWEDLTDALVAERERHREELFFIYGTGPSPFERGLQWLSRLSLGIATLGTVVLLQQPEAAARPVALGGVAGAAGVALLAAVVARARTQRRTDPRGERRLRFWSGALGRWAFRFAASGLRRGTGSAPDLQSLATPA